MSLLEDQTEAFLARIWFEPREIKSAPPVWRGVIEHIGSGERRYFVDLNAIEAFISEQIWGTRTSPGARIDQDAVRRWMLQNRHELRKQIFDGLKLTGEITEDEQRDSTHSKRFEVRLTFNRDRFSPNDHSSENDG